jgi:hypothetical protein
MSTDSNVGSAPAERPGLDWKAAMLAAVGPTVPLIAVILLAAWRGATEVACAAPLGWGLALVAGVRLPRMSRSRVRNRLLAEAAIAGGLVGLLMGILLVILSPMLDSAASSGAGESIGFALCLAPFGVVFGVGLAVVGALLAMRQRPAA